MKLQVTESKGLDEGKHTGMTTRLEKKDAKDKNGKPFEVLELYIQPDGVEFEVKYSTSTKLNNASKLGRLVCAFTKQKELKQGATVDLDAVLVGQKVSFMTRNEGAFARVIEDTLKVV